MQPPCCPLPALRGTRVQDPAWSCSHHCSTDPISLPRAGSHPSATTRAAPGGLQITPSSGKGPLALSFPKPRGAASGLPSAHPIAGCFAKPSPKPQAPHLPIPSSLFARFWRTAGYSTASCEGAAFVSRQENTAAISPAAQACLRSWDTGVPAMLGPNPSPLCVPAGHSPGPSSSSGRVLYLLQPLPPGLGAAASASALLQGHGTARCCSAAGMAGGGLGLSPEGSQSPWAKP